jgi:hypothetical protein
MPLDLSRMKVGVRQLTKTHDAINASLDKANALGATLQSHVEDFAQGLSDQISDIEFAANVLGNGSETSGTVSDTTEKKAEDPPPDPVKPASNTSIQPAAIASRNF